MLVTVSTSMLILVSTDVGDFTWAFERFRMPPQVGFALTAALRFLPDMISRTTLVLRAWNCAATTCPGRAGSR